jgi:two-component system, NarL family, sensor histidine kinase DegS
VCSNMGNVVTLMPRPTLDTIGEEALSAIAALEAHLSSLSQGVDDIRNDLDCARLKAQREREDLDIEYSLETGSSHVIEAPGTEDLRAHERALIEQTIRASRLHRELSEFTALLSTTQRQFSTGGELLGPDAGTQAAIRSAAALAQEIERQRLAREIHDGPAQALANAIIALEFVERAIRSGGDLAQTRSLEEVERIKATLREGLTEIRRFIFDLRPTMLQDRGLIATVEHYIVTYRSLFPMSIELTSDPSIPRLSHDQELTAFRVIQESIQNARKHARASRAMVSVRLAGAELVVIIEDNGRGFSPERVTTHMMGGAGLRGMEERAALVGGDIRIQSGPGEGTMIRLTIPLPAIERAPVDREGSDVAMDRSTDIASESERVQHEPV